MLNLKVDIDPNSGFCFGVVYAIQMAEDFLEDNDYLYCLGDIVHNDEEVKRLNEKGLRTISHDDLQNITNDRVLIRAHGEPPSTYELALKNNIELIDASCPVVLKLQNRVKESFDSSDNQVIIYGKHGHAEVKGLLGQTNEEAFVFQDMDELDALDLPPNITLFSQTTKSTDNLYKIKSHLEEKGYTVQFNDTICRQVSNREPQLTEFSKKFDKIVFVAGKKSSNGKVLYNVCKGINPNSYFISSIEEIDNLWFNEGDSIGICGATSTPLWLMESVQQHLQKI